MTAAGWMVLVIFWVIASFPAAVLTGQWLKRCGGDIEAMVDATREPPPLTDEHAGRLLRIVREDGEPR